MFHGKKPGVGIALHASALEMAYVPGGKTGTLNSAQVVRIPLSPEVYDNGVIKDADRFASRVTQTFRQLGWPRRPVTLALPASATVIRPLMVPKMKKPKLAPVIQYQIGKAITLPFSNAVFDVDYLPDALEVVGEKIFHGKNTETVPVLFVAAAGDLIQGLKQAFERAELGLSAIEVKGISILRALRALHQLPVRPTLLLEFGVDRVDVHYYQAGALLFTRTLDLTPEKYGVEGGDWAQLASQELADKLDRMSADLAHQLERLLTFIQHMLHPRHREDIQELWMTGVVPAPERVQFMLQRRWETLDICHVTLSVSCLTTTEAGGSERCSLSVIGTALDGGTEDAN